ncbi:DNA repair protein rhp41 [Plectosphaerella plurivora]|uniref:DNA repair protein rhp41 n=1 Tax=Plectosphaerella plurivora TaxID=936078 RepID=A0A9P8VAF0_9PEZI|nr:DNA repair protein rhp41 [Plectosphaerella plurivora]
MPPTVPRKRLRADSPPRTRAKAATNGTESNSSKRRKPTLYDDLDATSISTSKDAKTLLAALGSSEDDSSLSDLSDGDFEDVPLPQMTLGSRSQRAADAAEATDDEDEDEDDDESIEFEDVPAPRTSMIDAAASAGDLELTLHRETRISLTTQGGDKKGPAKIERRVRIATHCLHVQCLLWHNALRNGWLCDQEVQAIMLSHMPPKLFDEVERWRRASGLAAEGLAVEGRPSPKGKKAPVSKKGAKTKASTRAGSRDWGSVADRLEEGAVDMSHGDPLFRLMKALSSWWRQRFKTSAPGLRKQGYMSLERIDRITKAWLASLGLEARMVASLQPLGFGWSKFEDAEPEKDTSVLAKILRQKALAADAEVPTNGVGQEKTPKPPKKTKPETSSAPRKPPGGAVGTHRRSTRKAAHDDRGETEKLVVEHPDSDDDSVVELEVTPRSRMTTDSRAFDKDLEFPHYWTEVLSPVTRTYLSVDPMVKKVVATSRELVESLEPRGGKADKARQVMAYVVGYSQDGTAKDVTVRYLRRQTLPGKTKGMRMPIEKVPVYNRSGKVKKYEQYDWFKKTMSGFTRGTRQHPITEVDELEDTTDLKPAQPEKKEAKEGEETLQYYKQSMEYCLERHLKREEALLPGAKPVRMFLNKGKSKAKGQEAEGTEEPVYLRKDVANVKSAETWHKQGRAPRAGEQPLKRVPYRAATTNRRRELAEAEALSGEKMLQGLYSFEQTEWIIPPPIKDGVIPKNGYGNIDLFAEHMCPEGAVHIPFRGAAKVCKRLQIDYAEAVVDFEFGHRMAVPVIQGVVCAEEYHDQVMEEISKDEAEKTRKQDEKKRKEMLRLWSKFLKGLRIVERIREDYGHLRDDVEVFRPKGDRSTTSGLDSTAADMAPTDDADMGGGFLPEGHEDPEPDPAADVEPRGLTSNFFPPNDEEGDDHGDALVVEHGDA